MHFRRQTTICREGWYYLAILGLVFGGAMSKEVNLLLILAGMLLGPALLNWQAVWATLRGLRLDRKLPTWVGAGDVLSVGLSLTNGRRRLGSWAVVAEERIERETASRSGQQRATPLQPTVLFPYVRAGQSSTGNYRGRLAQRGRYRFGPVRLSTRFPFGLFSRSITVGETETLIVLPRLGRLTQNWNARRLEAFSGTDRRRRQPGPEGDFFGVREWRPGDGRRLIHWRSSARLGKLVVRQLERPRSRDVAIVLDLWQPESPTAKQLDTVERTVSFAATVLTDLCRKGGSNVYLGFDQSAAGAADAAPADCLGGSASPAILQGMMERLALAEAHNGDGLAVVLAAVLRRIAPETELVLVSTRPVDVSDLSSRFADARSGPMLRELLRRARVIDASSGQLDEYFETQ
ncbi:MAG: DUF58 domain-containing protein [Thermoguttaceae bacterium]